MQINKLLLLLVSLVYEKTVYEDTIFVRESLRVNVKAYLFA